MLDLPAMAGFIDILRSGRWLTRERMRLVAFALLAAFVLGAGFLIATSDGLNDRFGRPLGTDYSNVYAAGTDVLDGEPTAPFDPARQFAREQAIFGQATPFYGWHYPPFFLGLAALLATMPYWLSLLVWQGVTLVLYLLAIRAIVSSSTPFQEQVRKEWLLFALAFPAVFINLGQAHNGFLTAALIGGALALLDRRPVVAGVLIGCLAYKPQFGLLIPLVLALSGRWRVFAAAAATVALMALAVTLAFGPEVWTAFFASTKFTRTVVLEQGGTGWYKIQSVFSWVRMWGGGIPLAYAVQGAVTVTLAAALGWLWRSPAAYLAQGRRPHDRQFAGDALQPRLRPDAAGAGHRLSCARRICARLCPLRKNHSGRPVDSSAGRPFGSAGHPDSTGGSGDVAGFHPFAAPRHG